jgi:hypothetical protein
MTARGAPTIARTATAFFISGRKAMRAADLRHLTPLFWTKAIGEFRKPCEATPYGSYAGDISAAENDLRRVTKKVGQRGTLVQTVPLPALFLICFQWAVVGVLSSLANHDDDE